MTCWWAGRGRCADGGTGTDTADYSASNVAVQVGLMATTTAAIPRRPPANIEAITGSAFADVLRGGAGPSCSMAAITTALLGKAPGADTHGGRQRA